MSVHVYAIIWCIYASLVLKGLNIPLWLKNYYYTIIIKLIGESNCSTSCDNHMTAQFFCTSIIVGDHREYMTGVTYSHTGELHYINHTKWLRIIYIEREKYIIMTWRIQSQEYEMAWIGEYGTARIMVNTCLQYTVLYIGYTWTWMYCIQDGITLMIQYNIIIYIIILIML